MSRPEGTHLLRLAIFVAILIATASETLAKNSSSWQARHLATQQETDQDNEIDDRIHVFEPYKSFIQNSVRFALAQTKVPDHINLDIAMDVLNNAAYLLSKPSTILKVVETFTISIGILLSILVATSLAFPEGYNRLEMVWNDPINTLNLNRYLANGSSEGSVIAMLNSRADEILGKLGLHDHSCRKLSLCHTGKTLRHAIPKLNEDLIQYTKERCPNSGCRNYEYLQSFLSGYVDMSCSGINIDPNDGSYCIIQSLCLTRFNFW